MVIGCLGIAWDSLQDDAPSLEPRLIALYDINPALCLPLRSSGSRVLVRIMKVLKIDASITPPCSPPELRELAEIQNLPLKMIASPNLEALTP